MLELLDGDFGSLLIDDQLERRLLTKCLNGSTFIYIYKGRGRPRDDHGGASAGKSNILYMYYNVRRTLTRIYMAGSQREG